MTARLPPVSTGPKRLLPDSDVGRRIVVELRPRILDKRDAVSHVQSHVHNLLGVVLVLGVVDFKSVEER